MGILITVITIFLVILAVLIVLLILLQSDKNAGMGILGGGGSQSAFGSSTADVLTKMTGTMVALFMIFAFALSVIEAHRPKSIVDTLPKAKDSTIPKITPDESKPVMPGGEKKDSLGKDAKNQPKEMQPANTNKTEKVKEPEKKGQ